jgi:uncharacterized membrane protein YsdA (DUF1294 family)
MIKLALTYLVLINLIAFAAFGIDKWKARNNAWRIPEATLFLLAIIGGSIGAKLGMHVWHHKTKHLSFIIGIPVILLLQVVLFVLVTRVFG